VHKLVHAMERHDVPVAILPTGTANNVAHALGYDDGNDLFGHVTNWLQNERALLLAHVRAEGSVQRFVEVFGAGAFAAFVREESAAKISDPADTPRRNQATSCGESYARRHSARQPKHR
jgi:diacylglycerol kinase family enzyme